MTPVAPAYPAEILEYVAGKPAVDIGRQIHYSALDSCQFGRLYHLIQQKLSQQKMTCIIDSGNR